MRREETGRRRGDWGRKGAGIEVGDGVGSGRGWRGNESGYKRTKRKRDGMEIVTRLYMSMLYRGWIAGKDEHHSSNVR